MQRYSQTQEGAIDGAIGGGANGTAIGGGANGTAIGGGANGAVIGENTNRATTGDTTGDAIGDNEPLIPAGEEKASLAYSVTLRTKRSKHMA